MYKYICQKKQLKIEKHRQSRVTTTSDVRGSGQREDQGPVQFLRLS